MALEAAKDWSKDCSGYRFFYIKKKYMKCVGSCPQMQETGT